MPRYSGGAGASSSGGRVNESGCSAGERGAGAVSTRAFTSPTSGRDELGGPVAAARAVAPDELEEGGHDGAGSGRSEMSSPGKAAWCMAVRRSPGSTDHTREGGLLDGQDGAEVLEGGLAGAVAAPSLVGLDRGVGGDVDQPGPG